MIDFSLALGIAIAIDCSLALGIAIDCIVALGIAIDCIVALGIAIDCIVDCHGEQRSRVDVSSTALGIRTAKTVTRILLPYLRLELFCQLLIYLDCGPAVPARSQ